MSRSKALKAETAQQSQALKEAQAYGQLNPYALSMLAQQQQLKKDEWSPNIVPMQVAGVPAVQTQFAGTDYYNTVAPRYIAPGYEHLRQVANTRAYKADENRAAFERFKENIDTVALPGNLNPTKMMIKEMINATEKELENYDMADAGKFIKEKAHNITMNGLAALKTMEAKAKNHTDMAQEGSMNFTGEDGKGFSPSQVQAALATVNSESSYDPPQYDDNGNLVYSGNVKFFSPVTYRDVRNNLVTFADKIKADTFYSRDKKGNMILTANPDSFASSYFMKNEEISPQKVANVLHNALQGEGGYDYIFTEANAKSIVEMERLKQLPPKEQADYIRKLLTESKEDINIYNKDAKKEKAAEVAKSLKLSDEQLIKEAPNLIAKTHATKEINSIMNQVIGTFSFSKEDMELIENKEQAAAISKRYGKTDEEEEDTYQQFYNPVYINTSTSDSISGIAYETANLEADIKNQRDIIETARKDLTPEEFASSPHVQNALAKINSNEEALKNYEALLPTLNKQNQSIFYPVLEKIMGGPFKVESLYQGYLGKAAKLNTPALSRDKFFSGIWTAVHAERDNDDNTSAKKVFASLGIPTDIGDTSSIFASKFEDTSNSAVRAAAQSGQRGAIFIPDANTKAMQAAMKPIADNQLLNMTVAIAKESKKTYKDGLPKGYIDKDTLIFTALDNPSEKQHLAKAFKQFQDGQTSALHKQGFHYFQRVNPTGAEGIDLYTSFKKQYDADINEVLDLDKSTIALNGDVGRGNDRGKVIYNISAQVRPIGDKDSSEVKKAKQELSKAGNIYNIPVLAMNGTNQRVMDSQSEAVIRKIVEDGNIFNNLNPYMAKTVISLYANFSGIRTKVDNLGLPGLSGVFQDSKNTKALEVDGQTLYISGNNVGRGSRDLDYDIHIKENGVSKYLAEDKDGNKFYSSMDNILKHGYKRAFFESPEEITAFVQGGILQKQRAANFKKGGGGQGSGQSGFVRKDAPTSSMVLTTGKGTKVTHDVYNTNVVPLPASLPTNGNVLLPYIDKSVVDKATNVTTTYGLTVTGALRTKQHDLKGSSDAAENSKHFLGKGLDFTYDNKALALVRALDSDPSLKTRLGISYYLVHGKDKHLHLEFL